MLLTDVLVPFSTLSQTFHFFWPRKKDIILLLFSDIGVVKKFLRKGNTFNTYTFNRSF